MDKRPETMSMKNWLIRRMSTDMMLQERIIEAVIDHQYSSALDATKTLDSIEFSGFGSFMFNRKKARIRLGKCWSHVNQFKQTMMKEGITDRKYRSYEMKIETQLKNIEILNKRIDDKCQGDLPGVEESFVSVFQAEGNNSEG
jgi:predicted acylesterase/phospholipase RssA